MLGDLSADQSGLTERTVVSTGSAPSDRKATAIEIPLFTIEPTKPDFSQLDELTDDDGTLSDTILTALTASASASEKHSDGDSSFARVFEISPLSSKRESLFYMPFTENKRQIEELAAYKPDIILETDDGVFHIAENLVYTDVPQNEALKKLVDSVLK